jgi:hypothetical protein
MSGVLVLLIPLRGRILMVLVALIALVGMVALLGWWTLLSALVALLLLAGGGWGRLQTVDHHSTGYGSEDQCACDQDRPDHAKPVEEASYHVITNYQRRPRGKRSLESLVSSAGGEPVHVIQVAKLPQDGQAGFCFFAIAGEHASLG